MDRKHPKKLADSTVERICRECEQYDENWKEIPTASETNKSIGDIQYHAQELRRAFQDAPPLVIASLPLAVQKMLRMDRLLRKASKILAKEKDVVVEPELLRILRSIESSLRDRVAMVDSDKRRDRRMECVVTELERLLPDSGYRSMNAMFDYEGARFGYSPDDLNSKRSQMRKKRKEREKEIKR